MLNIKKTIPKNLELNIFGINKEPTNMQSIVIKTIPSFFFEIDKTTYKIINNGNAKKRPPCAKYWNIKL